MGGRIRVEWVADFSGIRNKIAVVAILFIRRVEFT